MRIEELEEREARAIVGRLLSVLTETELSAILDSMRVEVPTKDASRRYLSDKLMTSSSANAILANPIVLKLVATRLGTFQELIAKALSAVPKKQIEDLAVRSGVRIDSNESAGSTSETLVASLSFEDLFRKVLIPVLAQSKKGQSDSLKTAESIRSSLAQSMKSFDKAINGISDRMVEVEAELHSVSSDVKRTRDELRIPYDVNLETFLIAIRKLGADPSIALNVENIGQVLPSLLDQLKTDSKTLFQTALMYLGIYYAFQTARTLKWDPDKEDFYRTLKEEFDKIKIIGDRAEIPVLRRAVCSRMGIDSRTFDDLLTRLWKNGSVQLDPGAPIGEEKVDFLTVENRKFYYIRLRR